MWDLVIVGAGPAGAAAALGALHTCPRLKVLLLDRCAFPRDKACGDGVAPHVLDVLAGVGVTGLVDDRAPVRWLVLRHGHQVVERRMARPAYVVPRTVFDNRLVAAATAAGATFSRHRVTSIRTLADHVVLDGQITARVVVGADGAHSVVRRAAGLGRGRRALAIRGYAPTPPDGRQQQLIVFGQAAQPSYAWSFDRGDGLSNVGYGQILHPDQPAPARPRLLASLEDLLPGSTTDGQQWRGHHLPLSSWRWPAPSGRVLLAGDAAHLINPMTGEGIYYAVATGVLAGRAAATSIDHAQHGAGAGEHYARTVRSLLGRHLRHTAVTSRLIHSSTVLTAGLRAAAHDQAVFDDLVEVGLGHGLLTRRSVTTVARHAARRPQSTERPDS